MKPACDADDDFAVRGPSLRPLFDTRNEERNDERQEDQLRKLQAVSEPTPDLPKRMSEERLTELRGFACITYVAELFDHIDALTAENADLRRSLDVAETAFRVAEKIATASNNERDAARAECERLREELATTQRLYITAQDDIGYLDQRIANLKKELEHAVAQGYADLEWMARMQIVSAALELEAKYGAEKLHIKTTTRCGGRQ